MSQDVQRQRRQNEIQESLQTALQCLQAHFKDDIESAELFIRQNGDLHNVAMAFNSAARRQMDRQQKISQWGKSEVDTMILCFDLLKYANDMDQLTLGLTNTVVRTVEKAYL